MCNLPGKSVKPGAGALAAEARQRVPLGLHGFMLDRIQLIGKNNYCGSLF